MTGARLSPDEDWPALAPKAHSLAAEEAGAKGCKGIGSADLTKDAPDAAADYSWTLIFSSLAERARRCNRSVGLAAGGQRFGDKA